MTRRFHPSRRHHTGRGGRDDPGAHAPRGYRSALEQHLDARAQQERARRWRPQDTLKLARVISKLAPYKLREKHERILASHSLGRAHIHEALRMIYAHADWFELRVLLAQLGERRHAALVPVLAELASAASAFTRLLVVQTCGRIGHPAVEPLLLALCARREDRGVRVASLQVLALLGTPRAVRALGEVAQDPGVGLEAKRTVEAILARYPDVDFAPAGALTIADHSVAGALELARLGDGELALYEAGERAVRRVSKNKPGGGGGGAGDTIAEPARARVAQHGARTAPGAMARVGGGLGVGQARGGADRVGARRHLGLGVGSFGVAAGARGGARGGGGCSLGRVASHVAKRCALVRAVGPS
ncbi:MAG: HEAT repeat domain-containing protein [Myxococcota bacterium]